MPSPCEVVPGTPDPAVLITMDGERPRSGMPRRVFPAIAGGTFAGILLIGLGCTPLFQPRGANAAAEQPTIVHASNVNGERSGDENELSARVIVGESSHRAMGAGTAASGKTASASGSSTITASSSSRSGTPTISKPSDDAHCFDIDCEPMHDDDDKSQRPETVVLQGILASNATRAALLDGTLYREGDRFGAPVCPWTVASIDAGSVRIEKTLGDRVCGVTIRMADTSSKRSAHSSSTSRSAPATQLR